MQPNHRNLAFLLSIGSLPLSCGKSGDGDGDGTMSPATESTGGDGASTGTSTGTEGTPTTGGPGTTTEPQTTTSTATDTGTGATEDPPPDADPSCLAFGQHYVECYPRSAMYEADAVSFCQNAKDYGLRLDGQACADAFDAYYVCMSMVECAEFGSEDACAAEDMAILGACPLSEGSG